MTLLAIVFGTLVAGIGSVWVAAWLVFGLLTRHTRHLLSLAAGALLATAFMHLLPEAFESAAGAHDLFMAFLFGVLVFFLLDKAELWHHGHEHHHAQDGDPGGDHGHDHGHGHAHAHDHGPAHGHDPGRAHRLAQPASGQVGGEPAAPSGRRLAGGWAVLVGDSVHCFGDGLLLAGAFVADWRLGLLATLSVLVHEVPHHMGDLTVLRATTGTRQAALIKVTMAGAVTVLGGLVGYALVEQLEDYLPFFLVAASSSFVYVALADLIPQLQTRMGLRDTVVQVLWLLLGIALVTLVSGLAHAH